ncbi:MAG: 16S rRNA (adenine(1518)-N(6)/adenine(1519)-N(6))-dimethyltransferase RsmA, partial [Patescibacteria group bacterium]
MSIQALASKYGLNPSKLRGQNFLVDQNIVGKILEKAGLNEKDTVLEVGPGFGVLTKELVQRVKRVVAVELDKKISSFLQIEFNNAKNLDLVQGDILKVNIKGLNLKDYKIVTNLPYGISAHFLRKFLGQEPKPKEIVVMLQKEVGERIIAGPGEMSLLSLSVQFYAHPEILFPVSRGSFWPEPNVYSV